MKLVVCPACKKEVSAEAASCPSCGHPHPGGKPSNKTSDFSETDAYWVGVVFALVIVVIKHGAARAVAGYGLLAFFSWFYVIYAVLERLFR